MNFTEERVEFDTDEGPYAPWKEPPIKIQYVYR
jgi:hypothetical protein